MLELKVIVHQKDILQQPKNNHIPNRWIILYAFEEFRKVPKEWRQVFEDDDKLGSAKKEQASYIQQNQNTIGKYCQKEIK